MKKQLKKEVKPTREWLEAEVNELASELLTWISKTPDNIFVDDFLFIEKYIDPIDINFLNENFEIFKKAFERANVIEKTKIIKFAAADRLNTTIARQILINKHGQLKV